MKNKLRQIIREHISKLFEDDDYFPIFDFEDIEDMEGDAKQAFLDDLSKEGGQFMEPTKEEMKIIKSALNQATLDLPSDYEHLVLAQKMLEKQLKGIKTPEEIARLKDVMKQMAGEGGFN